MTRTTSGLIGFGVAALALLGGCAIGPDYKRPVVADPQTFRGVATAEAASLADLPWWEVFQDPILKELIHEALLANYDVQIAAARVQEARAGFVATRSDLFPSLGYEGTLGRSNMTPGILGGPGVRAPNASNFYSVTLAMSWELDIWGRIRRSTEAARANLLATEDFQRGVWLTAGQRPGAGVLRAPGSRRAAPDRAQQHGCLPAHVRSVPGSLPARCRFEARDGSGRGRSRGAQATVPQLESDIVAKENQISILLGKSPARFRRGTPMYEQPVVPAVPAGLPSTLLTRRPDLRQAEEQLVGANARIGVAKAEFFPKLNLTPLIGTASPELSVHRPPRRFGLWPAY